LKRCPNCQEPLGDGAILCTHCGHRFADIPSAPPSGFSPTPNIQKFGCGILILAALAISLWAFSRSYLAQDPEAAAVANGAASDSR
jgi:hypothetical protein